MKEDGRARDSAVDADGGTGGFADGGAGASAPDPALIAEANALAAESVACAHDALLVSYRFMNRAMTQLPARIAANVENCASDGRELVFAPGFALNCQRGTHALLARGYLHMTLHCLLRHVFPPRDVDPLRWSTACDLAVTAVMAELDGPVIHVEDAERDVRLAELSAQVDEPTAGSFYRLLDRLGLSQEELFELDLLFGIDSHVGWFSDEAQQLGSADDASSAGDGQANEQRHRELQEKWEKTARQTRDDLQAEQAETSVASPTLSTALSELRAEPLGLDELLRQFVAPRETLSVSPDEFDYIYYIYGLSTYGNVPLIEPLEYRDEPQVRDFVVAIDTSGSVQGPLVETFVRRACGMLLESGAFGSETRVRVIQCDCEIQDERVLTCPADVEAYLRKLDLKGQGGTDFRPVFERAGELLDSGDVERLEGLVYFTDGLGTYPEETPPYDVAFVFVDAARPVPSWATPVLTYSDELASSPPE